MAMCHVYKRGSTVYRTTVASDTGSGIWQSVMYIREVPLYIGRPWPVTLGLGYGLGYAMANCQHDFTRLPSPYLKPAEATPTPSENQVGGALLCIGVYFRILLGGGGGGGGGQMSSAKT